MFKSKDRVESEREMRIQGVMKIGWMVLAIAICVGLMVGEFSAAKANGNSANESTKQAANQEREFHQTYDLAPNGMVGLYNNSGNIRITTWNENRVKVDAVKHGRRDEDFARVQIEVSAKPDRIEVRVVYPTGVNWRGGGVSVDFDVKVPATSAISPVNTTSGDITVTGKIERVIARATSGNISVTDVNDTASLTTTSGNVTAKRVSGELRANASSGELILSEAGSRLVAQTASGSIHASDVRDDATAIVSSGDVRLEKIGGRAVAKASSGTVTINDVGGDAQADSMTDDVTVTNVRGRATVTAISGNIVLRNISEGIRARGVSGSVTVSDCNGVIEVNTTSDSIILTNIDSRDVAAKTTSGDVRFTGKIQDGGRYEFESFSSDVVLIIPPDSNFSLTAKTHNGSVNTEFPLQLTRTIGGSLMSGTIGKGGAEVRASSFSGSVQIKKGVKQTR